MKHSIPYMRETKTGWIYNPPWIAACKPPKAITMPKPRIEDSNKTIARLKKIKGDGCKRLIGKRAGAFYLASTDGYRALLLPGSGSRPSDLMGTELKDLGPEFGELPAKYVKLCRPFYTCLQRAAAFLGEEPWATSLTIRAGLLTVSAKVDGDTYREGVVEPGEGAVISFNAKYLLDALGVWPLYLHFSDKDCMVVLRPDDDSWRYLLIPLKL